MQHLFAFGEGFIRGKATLAGGRRGLPQCTGALQPPRAASPRAAGAPRCFPRGPSLAGDIQEAPQAPLRGIEEAGNEGVARESSAPPSRKNSIGFASVTPEYFHQVFVWVGLAFPMPDENGKGFIPSQLCTAPTELPGASK